MCKLPTVVVPENYDIKEQQDKCGEHFGIIECPACKSNYFDFGGMDVVACEDCNFRFAVDWYDMFSTGINDGRTVNASNAELSVGMQRRMENPYYKTGFENHTRSAWEERSRHDWRVVTKGWTQARCNLMFSICERCGIERDSAAVGQECMKCRAQVECRHRCSMMEDTCKAGVNFSELRATNPGIGYSLPCFYIAGTQRIHCDKFVAKSIEEIQADEDAINRSTARFLATLPLIASIKAEYAGRDWCGIKVCPVCDNRLHFGHVGMNGHIKMQCETDDCINFME